MGDLLRRPRRRSAERCRGDGGSAVGATAPLAERPDGERCRGDRGSAMVLGLVLVFAFTAGAVIWLARDVGMRVADQSAAQSVAFQAARTGAQQIVVGDLRGDGAAVALDEGRARSAAAAAGARLLAAYGLTGSTSVVIERDPPRVVVTVTVSGPGGASEGVGSARPERSG